MLFLLPAGRFASYALLALIVFACALKEPGFLGSEKASPVDMLVGTAHKPYVYRVLVPMTSRLLTGAIPSPIRQQMNSALLALSREMRRESMYGATVARKLNAESALLVELTIASLLMYAALVAFSYALRWLATGVCHGLNPVCLDLLGAAALLGLLPFFRYFTYLYDFPTLLLFTMGLGCIARHRWWLLITVYSVGCLNKETTILLSLVFWLYAGHRRILASPQVALLPLSQGLIFATIRASLQWTFRYNPGSAIEFHLLDHNIGGMPPCSLGSACGMLMLAILVACDWRRKPALFRDGMVMLLPLVFLNLLFGYLDELRDYYEVYPIVLLLAGQTVMDVVNTRNAGRIDLARGQS